MENVYSEENLHIKDYLSVLRRHRKIIAIFFLTTVLAVTVGSFLMRPLYRATVTLFIDIESSNILTASGSVEFGPSNYYSYKEYFQSQVAIITSEPLARQIFKEFNLGASKEYANAREPIKKFLKAVSAEPERDTRLLKLNVDDHDPVLATKIANCMAELYVRRNLAYISKNELLNLLKNEYLKLQSKLSEYRNIYKEGHPEMVRLNKEIDDLTKEMEEEKKSVFDYSSFSEPQAFFRSPLEGLRANNVSIVAPAVEPVVPLKPKKLLNIFLAVIFGLFGGAGMAFFLEYMDDTVKDFEDIEKLTNWPFLGSVPTIAVDAKTAPQQKELFVETNPKDPIAEAYRSFRTRVLFASTEEHPLKSILITSLGPGEGKTVTLCNLGIALVQNQKKVLLVDTDMRKARLHDVFKNGNERGLSSFLCGQANFAEIIQKTDIENLSMATAGPIPPNPAELIASNKMKEFLAKVKEEFDFVLFDSPPIALLTDASILSCLADGVIVVTESGRTSRRALLHSYKLIKDSKARVIGIFLNKISLDNSRNYYYYHYSPYYSK